ncbi:hypothetical protein Afil01_53680 [Actinorhabdospora filicis]|uniref:DUF4247 domain-containing protein n=1 Tax=Actinorhabdospora filicis TaxID=1785913 RepID=A0A9W6STP0_9ACTN|nr:DUF4247 domain-containing protein [Actinorhabdospora filicis]GLZ80561.1 hypothetical protein Afil01_53680 [Actinorhabdospora filicis]
MSTAASPTWSSKKKIIWFVVLLTVAGGLIAACAIATSANNAPDSWIRNNYTRDVSLDEDDIDAFTSTAVPTTVAAAISGQSKPVDTKTASDGSIWLQYSDDIVAIFPYNGGSKIMIDEYERVHRHYYGYVGGWWVSSPPGGGWGRGGGSGGGGK